MTDSSQLVTAGELMTALQVVLAELKGLSGEAFVLDDDFFWSVPVEDLYNPYAPPAEFTLGQLSDSVEHVKRVADGQSPPVGYHLVWIADVLRAIGQRY